MKRNIACLASLTLTACLSPAWASSLSVAPAAPAQESRTFEVHQSVTLKEIPKSAREVRLWVSLPDDDPAQRVLDMTVLSAPGAWKLVHDKDRGARFLYLETANPGTESLTATVAFVVRRQAVFFQLDPARAAALSESQKRLFADELRTNAPHMEVNETIRHLASEICGAELNPVRRAFLLLDYVADHADHYSKNPAKPTCGVGDAANCLANGGGCCTDLHSLFIALARATGIPARLQMGYRLQPKNAGLEVDPGYRCWVEFFLSGFGWVPADVVEAQNADPQGRSRWLSGLTERRIHLNEGREFDLPLRQNPAPVNLMTIAYAEIDGQPVRVLPEGDKKPQLSRTIKYTERSTTEAHLLSKGS